MSSDNNESKLVSRGANSSSGVSSDLRDLDISRDVLEDKKIMVPRTYTRDEHIAIRNMRNFLPSYGTVNVDEKEDDDDVLLIPPPMQPRDDNVSQSVPVPPIPASQSVPVPPVRNQPDAAPIPSPSAPRSNAAPIPSPSASAPRSNYPDPNRTDAPIPQSFNTAAFDHTIDAAMNAISSLQYVPPTLTISDMKQAAADILPENDPYGNYCSESHIEALEERKQKKMERVNKYKRAMFRIAAKIKKANLDAIKLDLRGMKRRFGGTIKDTMNTISEQDKNNERIAEGLRRKARRDARSSRSSDTSSLVSRALSAMFP